MRSLAQNLTYDEHYRLAVYVDCKPCPINYACDYEQDPPTCSDRPSLAVQELNLARCLEANTNKVCVNATHGSPMNCESHRHDPCVVEYDEGDLFKCSQIPYFCDDQPLFAETWRVPMEYCKRGSGSESCSGRSYKDSRNNFLSGQTAMDFDLLTGSMSDSEELLEEENEGDGRKAWFERVVGNPYRGWVQSYANYGYECNATESTAGVQVSAKAAAAALLSDSYLEYALKPFTEDTVGYDSSLTLLRNVTGCCQCEPHSMPEFFNTQMKDAGFPDNKHADVQLVVSALKDTELTICFELQHGQYVSEFETAVKRLTTYRNGTAEFLVHVPYRAKYSGKPTRASGRASFLALINSEIAEQVAMPLNLPRKFLRDPQSLPSTDYSEGYSPRFEYDIIIDRPARWDSSDPCNYLLETGGGNRNGWARRELCNFPYREFKRSISVADINTDLAAEYADDGQGGNIPYMVADGIDMVKPLMSWWRNPPNTGEDAAVEAPFDTYPSTWQEGLLAETSFTSYGDATSSAFMATNENEFLFVPWLPYFSNCDGYDSHIMFMRLLETHPDCITSHLDFESTQYSVQMPFAEGHIFEAPVSDTCLNPTEDAPPAVDTITQYSTGIELDCSYEEDVQSPASVPRWFELPAGTVPFYLTKYPVYPADFETDWTVRKTPTADPRWGRGYALWQQKDGEKVLPVEVDEVFSSDVGVLPRRVKLYIEYFQESPGEKRLVKAALQFFDLCYTTAASQEQIAILERPGQYKDSPKGIRPCNYTWDGHLNDTGFTFEFTYKPAKWVDLLNYFELKGEVYMVFYTAIGIVSIIQAVAIWLINRLLTRLRHPPPFHAQSLLAIVTEAPMIGVSLAIIPIATICLIVFWWFKSFANFGLFASDDPEQTPSAFNLEGADGNWNDSMGLSADQIFTYAYGRTGVCFVAIGLYLNFLCASLIVPNWNDDEEEGGEKEEEKKTDEFGAELDEEEAPPPLETWAPILWKRSHLIMSSLFLQFCLLGVWEFSYSQWFEDNVYEFIIMFKCIQVMMDILFKAVMKEHLMSNPLIILVGMTEIMVTMGASDFTEFVLSYFVDLAIVCIERLYLDPLVKTCYKLWPRWKMQLNRRFGNRRKMTREDKAKEEMEWRRVNEAIELEAEGIEPLMDSFSVYSTEVTAMLITPILNLFLMVFREETLIPSLYGIRETDLVFYAFFNFYILIFSFIEDVFILNAAELVHGWKVFDYISYQRYRFSVRENRWVMDAKVVDESITPGMQMLDVFCFSEQYFFLLALSGFGGMISMFGLSIFFRHQYNMFGDPVLLLVLMVIFVLGDMLQIVFVYLANIKIRRLGWRGLWMTKHIEGTVDDDVAAKLAIGEGRQADLEQERLELQALNSERFRHRFLDRNRPWILQHLVELLTPESLQEIGPDGRPVVEYIRDVYAELLAMGEGARQKGDRSDISSDEEEERGPGANWPRAPLKGTNLAIARLWLAKARRRRAFHKLIAGVIANAVGDVCEVCGRTRAAGATLNVTLATDGFADERALDRLIHGFEVQYGEKEDDANLWRAYFRAHAEFITRCERCVNELEQGKLQRDVEKPGAKARTRAVDMSSDEEEEDVMFDPVVVVREAPEGRMLSKWLDAARRRCGGTFPRPEARKQMEEYAEKMRQRKLRKAKDRKAAGKGGGGDGLESSEDEAGDDAAAKWKVAINAAGKALAQRWLRLAQDSMLDAFKSKGLALRKELAETLKQMAPEDDWYFGAEMRVEGAAVAESGDQLAQDMRTVEAEEAVKIRRVDQDREEFETSKRAAIDAARSAFEATVAADSDRADDMIEIRTRELQRNKEETKKEFDEEEARVREEEGGVPPEMAEEHRARLEEMDSIARVTQQRMEREKATAEAAKRAEFDAVEREEEQTIVTKRVNASAAIRGIRKAALAKMKTGESAWQAEAAKWLFAAQRKIELKRREDDEDAAKKKKKKRK